MKKNISIISLLLLCIIYISSTYSVKEFENNKLRTDTCFFHDGSYVINSWTSNIFCNSKAYGTSVAAGKNVYYCTGYGTGVDKTIYQNKTASAIIIGSGTNYTLTASWTNVTAATMTKDMFIVMVQRSNFLAALKIDTLLLPLKQLEIIDSNYIAGAYYSYRWSTGDTVSAITINNPGWYKVTVTKDLQPYINLHNIGIGDGYRFFEIKDSIEVVGVNIPIRVNATILIKDGNLMIYKTYKKK